MSKFEWGPKLRQLGQTLGKFKYPLLIFALGLLLVAIPTRQNSAQTPKAAADPEHTATDAAEPDSLRTTEENLEQILSQIEGAGQVQIMMQYATGTKTIYQTDTSQEVSTDSDGKKTKTDNKTVLASGSSSVDAPVAMQIVYPTFQGALVVSQGAGSAAVRLNLVNAVSSLTGLGADKITVVKMKSE